MIPPFLIIYILTQTTINVAGQKQEDTMEIQVYTN